MQASNVVRGPIVPRRDHRHEALGLEERECRPIGEEIPQRPFGRTLWAEKRMGAGWSKQRESEAGEREKGSTSECPVMNTAPRNSNSASGCPASPEVFNVYGEVINKDNMMPVQPNQAPAPGQRVPLPTERTASSIPKAGTAGQTWSYPSEQMFFNALMRKGKADGVSESDMPNVVAAHNTLNEATWREVLKYEYLPPHGHSNSPELRRFMGKSDVLSPLAYAYSLLGYSQPFDRHDWFVQRNGSREMRYVIDFYHNDTNSSSMPFTVNARPALDSIEAVQDRLKLAVYTQCYRLGLPCPVTGTRPGSSSSTADVLHSERSQSDHQQPAAA